MTLTLPAEIDGIPVITPRQFLDDWVFPFIVVFRGDEDTIWSARRYTHADGVTHIDYITDYVRRLTGAVA